MKRRRVLGILFLAGQRRFARAINGAANGRPLAAGMKPLSPERETLSRLIQGLGICRGLDRPPSPFSLATAAITPSPERHSPCPAAFGRPMRANLISGCPTASGCWTRSALPRPRSCSLRCPPRRHKRCVTPSWSTVRTGMVSVRIYCAIRSHECSSNSSWRKNFAGRRALSSFRSVWSQHLLWNTVLRPEPSIPHRCSGISPSLGCHNGRIYGAMFRVTGCLSYNDGSQLGDRCPQANGIWPQGRQSPGGGDLTARARLRRLAPGSSSGAPARRQARGAAHDATLRLSGAAHH